MPITKLNQLIREVAFPSYSMIQEKEKELRYYFLKNIRLISKVLLPKTEIGDLIGILVSGAYGFSASPQYFLIEE